MTRAELLARIRKCMMLSASGNEHEAAAALSTAQRLMAEYGVDQAEVELANVGEHQAAGGGRRRPPQWEVTLAASVMRAITVKAIFNESGVLFIGLTPAPEVAGYAFIALYRQCKRARADYIAKRLRRCKPARKRARADAFCEGWASGVWRAIAAIAPNQPLALIVQRYLAERHDDTVKVNARSGANDGVGDNDRGRGYVQGRDVRLQHGVAGQQTLQIGNVA